MDAVATPSERGIRVISLDQVEPIALPGGSWSKMLLTEATAPPIKGSLGYSIFLPGSATAMVSHEVEEVAFVVQGRGEMRLDGEAVPFSAGDALYIAARTWHAVANTGDEDVVMVFGFAYPGYPPTERR